MKYPGKILDPETQLWFQNAAEKAGFAPSGLAGEFTANPCVRLYGPGPENTRCKDCRQFFWHKMNRRYFKCALRGCTHGPATDHRANWPACKRFVKHHE
jgi:hypothetical protein